MRIIAKEVKSPRFYSRTESIFFGIREDIRMKYSATKKTFRLQGLLLLLSIK